MMCVLYCVDHTVDTVYAVSVLYGCTIQNQWYRTLQRTYSSHCKYRIKKKTHTGEIAHTHQSDEGCHRSRVRCEFFLQLDPPVVCETSDVFLGNGDGRCALTLEGDLRGEVGGRAREGGRGGGGDESGTGRGEGGCVKRLGE